MIEALKKLVTGDTPPARSGKLAKLEAKAAEAQQALAAAQQRYEAACGMAEADDDPKTAKELAAAIAGLRDAEQRQANLRTALKTERAALADQQREAATAALAERWREIGKLADQRHALAQSIDDHASGLAASRRSLASINAQIRAIAAAEPRIVMDGSATLIGEPVETLSRLALCKAGERWAISWLDSLEKIPTTAAKMRRANDALSRARGNV